MKYLRTAIFMLLLVGLVVFAYETKKPMAKEEVKKAEEVERPTKIVPMKVKTERPKVEQERTIVMGMSRGPLNEGFEGGVIPGYWTVIDKDGDSYEWEAYSSATYAHTGSHSARIRYNVTGCDDWLITPLLVVAVDDSFAFWARSRTDLYLEDFNVKLSTTTTDLDSFNVTLGSVTDVPDTYTLYAYDLSSYVGDTIYCAIQCVSVNEFYLHVDDISGPEWLDLSGPTISEILYPIPHFATGLDDSIIAFITDLSGVDSAFVQYYVAAWNPIEMDSIGVDSFAATIPAQSRGTTVNWYIEAWDSLGNYSTDPPFPYAYTYSILPSSENLIVYEVLYDNNALELIDAFYNLEYSFDYMMEDTATAYPDSVAALWERLWWVTGSSGSPLDPEDTTLIADFLNYPEGADSSDRNALFLSGDDIGYDDDASRHFLEKYFRSEYIQDDLSFATDNIDTAVGIPGHPITGGMPDYTLTSSYPDLVFSKAKSQGDSVDASFELQIIVDGDSVNTPGGLVYNGLTWRGVYLPYEMVDFDSAAARDTLIRRIMEAISFAPMPQFVDDAYLDIEHVYGVPGSFSTEILGYAYEEDGDSNYFATQVGMGQMGDSLPDAEDSWLWFDATLVDVFDSEFEFVGQIDIPDTMPPGDYSIAYRFSYEYGPWIYADLDGFSSEKGFDYQYDPEMAGTLTVIPKIVINEILYDTPGEDDSLFTELYGPPGTSLDSFILYGVDGFDGDVYEVIELTGTIPSDSFFVVASEDIGVQDLIDNVDWQDGPDNVVLGYVAGEETITVDSVGYGSYDTTGWVFTGEGMPAPDVYVGHSLYRAPLDSDNNLQDFVGSGIFTPGTPNFGPPTWVTISDIQGADTITPYLDSLVELTGVITASDGYYIFLQDASGPWNGIAIEMQDYPVSMGDSVVFVCSPIENSNETRLVDRSMIQNLGSESIVPASFLTTPADVDTNEANEGVLVELNLVTVVDYDIKNGEWLVSDGFDTCVVDVYYSYVTPDLGDIISILRGPVAYTFGDYKIEPRGDFDILSFDEALDSAYTEDTISVGIPITPYAWVGSHLDDPEDSFYVYFEVDSAGVGNIVYIDSVRTWVAAGSSDSITFNEVVPPEEHAAIIRYFTALDLDINTSNDTLEHYVIFSGVAEEENLPTMFELVVPGVSFGMSSIKYAVPEKVSLSISLFDKLGRRISILVDKVHSPGYYEFHLAKLDIPSGIYFIKMNSSSFQSIKKTVLMR